ncbi:hypothetical protein [Pseudomonas syringae]|uniref:hypothetical protein n=1 Tax=Pseudomonas syringae TaxID=317 RepID=UPI001F471946|nr:hypothetical protein [Pseudomonas syringae]MCF5374487.1 hypothetical protein [Pseudomonas syringae]MCF5381972.1 hypothetical protein [Pseudomonas syringae]MCF5419496.1 hypothetical protein [Pseudomonas syringae]MCF5454830.1 hypothetical protein [Pseudomonas syringae]MCF5456328.1 hypothetical protein [Pseudomonas syringae]
MDSKTLEAQIAAEDAVFVEMEAESVARRYINTLMGDVEAVEQRLNLGGALACWATIEQNAETHQQKPTYWRDMRSAAGGTIGCLSENEGVDINAELGRIIY